MQVKGRQVGLLSGWNAIGLIAVKSLSSSWHVQPKKSLLLQKMAQGHEKAEMQESVNTESKNMEQQREWVEENAEEEEGWEAFPAAKSRQGTNKTAENSETCSNYTYYTGYGLIWLTENDKPIWQS